MKYSICTHTHKDDDFCIIKKYYDSYNHSKILIFICAASKFTCAAASCKINVNLMDSHLVNVRTLFCEVIKRTFFFLSFNLNARTRGAIKHKKIYITNINEIWRANEQLLLYKKCNGFFLYCHQMGVFVTCARVCEMWTLKIYVAIGATINMFVCV